MIGPEHYREAERLLTGAQNVMEVAPVDGLTQEECTALAQVHATLALAAATAMADTDAMREADHKAWKAAAGCPTADGDVR